MSALGDALVDYLGLRRALGHNLADAARLLPGLVAHLEATGARTLTVAEALAWACAPEAPPGSTVHGRRMTAARGFARYLVGVDPATEVPPASLLPMGTHRATPYLYTGDDVAGLLRAARGLRSPLRAATYETLIGLLWVSGMRIGEALRLTPADLRAELGVAVIRASKFSKSREVALAGTTFEALDTYLERRGDLRGATVFVSRSGTPLSYAVAQRGFAEVVSRAGLPPRPPARPRLHDFRHVFAVRTLLDWHAQGLDVEALLPRLSTHLGHVEPASTYWYLSATPELLGLAARRLAEVAP